VFDDIIKPAEKFYDGDDSPIEFEAEFEIDEDANVGYSFKDLEKVLSIDEEELDKAIDDAMKLLFDDDDCPGDCDKDDTCDKQDLGKVPEPDHCDDVDCCGCENDETVSESSKAWGI
jgi:hypothetical protein